MNIAENIQQIQAEIERYASACHRQAESIQLLAVSKGQSVDKIREAYALGLHAFAENYVQEALGKMSQLEDLAIDWQFIGSLQSNKAASVARHFSWIHSLSSLKVAKKLAENRPEALNPIQVCIQVNLSGEASKSGLNTEDAKALVKEIASYQRLTCRGLMTIPPANASSAEKTALYRQLNDLLQSINREIGLNMDTLSMGMSGDFEQAIAAGSTVLRIGQALFGKRAINNHSEVNRC